MQLWDLDELLEGSDNAPTTQAAAEDSDSDEMDMDMEDSPQPNKGKLPILSFYINKYSMKN